MGAPLFKAYTTCAPVFGSSLEQALEQNLKTWESKVDSDELHIPPEEARQLRSSFCGRPSGISSMLAEEPLHQQLRINTLARHRAGKRRATSSMPGDAEVGSERSSLADTDEEGEEGEEVVKRPLGNSPLRLMKSNTNSLVVPKG